MKFGKKNHLEGVIREEYEIVGIYLKFPTTYHSEKKKDAMKKASVPCVQIIKSDGRNFTLTVEEFKNVLKNSKDFETTGNVLVLPKEL